MSATFKVGDRVRIRRGACGEGFTFDVSDVTSVPADDQVYGRHYGPVRASDLELVVEAASTLVALTIYMRDALDVLAMGAMAYAGPVTKHDPVRPTIVRAVGKRLAESGLAREIVCAPDGTPAKESLRHFYKGVRYEITDRGRAALAEEPAATEATEAEAAK